MPTTQFPASIDVSTLTGTRGFAMTGFSYQGQSGHSVSGIGDLNNDGIEDIVVGAIAASSASGIAYVIFGKSGIGGSSTLDISSLTGANGFVLSGFPAGSEAGSSVCGRGDLNNDGIADLVVGAPYALSGSGASYVIFGKSGIGSSGTLSVSGLTGSNGFIITGFPGGSNGGYSVSFAGDINADSITDLIIGAIAASSNAGACYVIFGKSGIGGTGSLDVSVLTGTNGFLITGFPTSSQAGWSVTGAGDINDDGIADLMIGAPDALNAAGTSYVIFGKPGIGGSGILDIASLTGSNGFTITGFPTSSGAGQSVSSAGDINNDGIADLVVGAPGAFSLTGTSYVIFGQNGIGSTGILNVSAITGSNGFTIVGFPAVSQGGYSHSGAGDLNGDGITDLVIGAPAASGYTGASYLIFGKSGIGGSGTLTVSSLTGANGFAITGFPTGSEGGYSINFAGDFNNDGIADAVVGAPNVASNTGTCYVIFGDSLSSLIINRLMITKGKTLLIAGGNLNATYPSRSIRDPSILFTVSAVQHGFFSLINDTYSPMTSFLQQQVRSQQVQFTHDDSAFPPSYSVQLLGDGGLMTMAAAQPAQITFIHRGAVLVNNQLAIGQGQTVTLFSTQLSSIDLDIAADNPNLIFTVSNVQHGFFQQAGNPGYFVTSFLQSQIQIGSIQFVHDGSSFAPSYSVAVSDGSIVTTPKASIISFDQAPILENNSLSLNQGQNVVLTGSMLSATDPDNVASSLQFLVSNVQHGQFELVTSPGNAITSFTQGHVQGGFVQFVPDGSIYAPSYSVAMSDSKITTTVQASTITFNAAPVLNMNKMTVQQGQSIVLTSSMLSATDPDDATSSLTFITSKVLHGQFEFVSASGIAITSFTQAELQSGSVQFVADGSITAPSFNIAVSDGKMTIPATACTISFDAAPVLTVNSLSLSQGQTVLLSSANLVATDPDNTPASLTFIVSSVQHGYFQRVSSPGIQIITFTQGELQNSVIQFVSDGSSNAPSYTVAVSDGVITTLAQSSTVIFNIAPTLVNNTLAINQGQSVILTSSMLSATDPDDTTASLIFIVSGVQYGHFESLTNKGVVISSFTQAELQAGQIQFITDGSSNAPKFSVAVGDGKISTSAQFSSVSFHVSPVLVNNALTLKQGQSIVLNSSDLSATDAGVASDNLIFMLSSITGGRFELLSAPGSAITSFTQAQIQAETVQFVQDGTATVPAFSVAVSDGSITTPAVSSAITFNAAPILAKNQLAITEASSHIMTPDDLSATDDHTATGDLVFTASGVLHGQFEDISLPGTPLTVFTQQKVTGGDLRFISDGSAFAPHYNISVSDGSLKTIPMPAIVNFATSTVTSGATNNTIRNAIIGGTVSGGIGLAFFALRFGIAHASQNTLQSQLNKRSSAVTGELKKFYYTIVEPLAKQIFAKLKTTSILGYRSERDTKDYIAAIETIVIALNEKGINLSPRNEADKLRIINEVAHQTKKLLVPYRSCLSSAYCRSFYRADVTPTQMKAKAGAIAKATYSALEDSPGLITTPVERESFGGGSLRDVELGSDLELHDMKKVTIDLKEGEEIAGRITKIEQRLEALEIVSPKSTDRKSLIPRTTGRS